MSKTIYLKVCNSLTFIALLLLLMLLSGTSSAAVVNWFETTVDPILDGSATNADEWALANASLNDQGDGSYYAQWKQGWNATSSSGNTINYAGVTLFDMHNMDGATTQDSADYNVFEYTLVGGDTIKAWVFANDNELDDSTWLSLSGLGSSYSTVDDIGFIVRLNNDPTTDVQWFTGDAEPGDIGFNWSDYYGFFGTSGFNNSAFDQGLAYSIDGINEVYEVALYGEAFGSGSGDPFVPCVTDIYRTVKDPKNGEPSQVLVDQMVGPGHVNIVPVPSALFLSGFGVLTLGKRRHY